MEGLLLHSPENSKVFTLFGLTISWYGVIVALAMLIALIVAYFICKRKGYDPSILLNSALFALPLALIGARLYYCILHGVSNFWEIFKVWEGGMAIYGAVIGGFIGILIASLIYKYPLLQICDIGAPPLLLGQSIGRIGCYFAGCCYGIEPPYDILKVFPISVQIEGVWHLSTFFYECVLNFIGFLLLWLLMRKTRTFGITTSAYFIVYGTVRAVLEEIRDPKEALMLGDTGIRASQLLSVVLVIVGTILLFVLLYIREHKREYLPDVKF